MNVFFQCLDAVDHRQLKSSRTGELYSQSAVLSELIGLKDVFVHHEILAPKRRSSAPHTHSDQEEMIFVLEGHPTVHVGKDSIKLKPGAFIGFSPGGTDAHFVENQTDDDVRLLVISPRFVTDKVQFASEHLE